MLYETIPSSKIQIVWIQEILNWRDWQAVNYSLLHRHVNSILQAFYLISSKH